MKQSDINSLRKKYFSHPVLINSKIISEEGIDYLIELKYAGIHYEFFNKSKFESFIKKYDLSFKKVKTPKKKPVSKKKKPVSKKKKRVAKKKSKARR